MIEIKRRIQNEFTHMAKGEKLNSYFTGHLLSLFKDRMNHYGIRSYFVNTITEYIKEQAASEGISLKNYPEEVFNTYLPFISEGIITVQYCENQILDGKGELFKDGRFDMNLVNRNLLAGHYLKDLLYKYIGERIFPKDCNAYRISMNKIHEIYQLVDLGQTFEDKWGTYQAFKRSQKHISISNDADIFINKKIISSYWTIIRSLGLIEDKEVFVRNYLRRIYLTSGSLFILMAELVMDLLNYHGKERQNIIDFSAQTGMLAQIVNDINDFVPSAYNLSTISKKPGDAFADLRNNNVTLPLLFHFNTHRESDIHEIQKLTQKPFLLIRELQKGIFKAQEVAQKASLLSIPLIKENSYFGFLLLDMNSIVDSSKNRFFKAIEHSLQDCKEHQPPSLSIRREKTLNPSKLPVLIQKFTKNTSSYLYQKIITRFFPIPKKTYHFVIEKLQKVPTLNSSGLPKGYLD